MWTNDKKSMKCKSFISNLTDLGHNCFW